MKRKRLLTIGLIFLTGILNAQTDFQPGYIIKNSGDTLFGQIDYRGDLMMSSKCKFKNFENIINEYSPNDIAAFRFIDSKYYVSREINNKKVFLEYLIKGKANIYYMRDEVGDHYYIDKENVRLTEIPFEEGIKYVEHKRVFFETTRHMGILNYYMQDAPGFQKRIQTIKKPEHQSLINLAEDYHNAICKEEKCIIYKKTLPLIKISIASFAGLTKYNDSRKFLNEFGGYIYLWTPRTHENLFIKTGLIYQKKSEYGENLKIYKIPLQFQYIYRVYRIQPNISAGYHFFSLRFDDYNIPIHTLNLNTGFDYKISKKIYLSAAFYSDFTSFSDVIIKKTTKFSILSYSILFGLKFEI